MGKISVLAEKYVFSIWFLYLAYGAWQRIGPLSAESVKQCLVLGFMLTVGVNLLGSQSPVRPPRRIREVLVPLGGTFLSFAYAMGPHQPWTSLPRLAVLVSITGYALSLWAACYLGRSFGIFVSVRKPIFKGPYQYIRHPMYVGHALQLLGVCLAWLTPYYVALTGVYYGLLLWRARLEEQALANHSAAYDWYMDHVPSFIP